MEEKKSNEPVEVKVVEEAPQTPQEKEVAVLDKAVKEGEVSEEYGLQEDGVYKINVDKPPKQPKQSKKIKEDAIQEPKTKETVLRDEGSEVELPSVGSEVRETPKNAKEIKEEIVEKPTTESND